MNGGFGINQTDQIITVLWEWGLSLNCRLFDAFQGMWGCWFSDCCNCEAIGFQLVDWRRK